MSVLLDVMQDNNFKVALGAIDCMCLLVEQVRRRVWWLRFMHASRQPTAHGGGLVCTLVMRRWTRLPSTSSTPSCLR